MIKYIRENHAKQPTKKNQIERQEEGQQLNKPTNYIINVIIRGLTVTGESNALWGAYVWAVYNINFEYIWAKIDE